MISLVESNEFNLILEICFILSLEKDNIINQFRDEFSKFF